MKERKLIVMKYCCKCGEIFSDESEYYYSSTCAHCGTFLSSDDMTSQRFKCLSECEKDEYELKLLEIVKKSSIFDAELYEKYSQPGTPFFYYCHRYDKYEELKGIKKENPPEDKGCGTILAIWFFIIILGCILFYAASIQEEHPFISLIVALFATILAVFGKGLICILFPNFTKEQENKRNEKYRRHHGATCPYCHSTNTSKISNISKGIALGLFGKYALYKVHKQWHCNNCGADF